MGLSKVSLEILFQVICLTACVNGHSNGAPESRCSTMVPGHWVTPQTTPCPYRIIVSGDVLQEGERLFINLTSTNGQDGFKGFLLQAKKHGEESPNYGSFDILTSTFDLDKVQPIACFENENSAVTHATSDEKRFLTFEWIAPIVENDDGEDFEILATFVQNFWTIWANQSPGLLVRVVKKPGKVESAETESENNPTPNVHLIPQVRNSEAKAKSPSPNENPSSGSWEFFKQSWTNFLRYFSFDD